MKRRQFVESLLASACTLGTRPLLASSLFGGKPGLTEDVGFPPAKETELVREFFYRPLGAHAGDFIPYYKDGRFHLFFLLDWRDKPGHGEGVPWYQVSTTDFVHFVEHGEMLPRGTRNDQDLYVFTGSAMYGEGQYHIFYCGFNPYFADQGKPGQAVMHAVSHDLLNWQKIPEDTFYASGQYERNDWRDPFVFWNPEANEYWMILAARLKNGPSRRRGCTALCTSKDLKKWEVRDPFWAPGLYFTHECPDLFKIGDWWYLVFSEFSELIRTRYRMSPSLDGPWITPKRDYFDGRAYYAAKTASDGQHRYLFGWEPSRAEDQDYYRWDWGGNLVVHQLHQESDGTLSVTVPPSIDAIWTKPLSAQFALKLGQVKADSDQVELTALGSFACAAADVMPDRCKIEAQARFDSGTRGFGLMLRTSDDLESSYYVRFEPQNQRLVVDSWPRAPKLAFEPKATIEGGFIAGLDSWIPLDPEVRLDIKVLVDRSTAVVYFGGRSAMTLRMYDLPVGRWGFFVEQGTAQFRNIKITGL
jgi:beta-fructofuranosidase